MAASRTARRIRRRAATSTTRSRSKRTATMLDPATLVRAEVTGSPVVRSAKFIECDPIYRDLHMNGFEFTHLDVISKPEARSSYERKAERLLALRGKGDVVFLYHHRYSGASDLPLLREKLKRFADLYRSETAQCLMACFYQMRLPANAERRTPTRFKPHERPVRICLPHRARMGRARPGHLLGAKRR